MTPKNYYLKSLTKLISKITLQDPKKYIVLKNTLSETFDIQKYLTKINNVSNEDTRLVVIYYNHFWEPVLKIASLFGFRSSTSEQNWLDTEDIKNLLDISGFEAISSFKTTLLPIDIPILSNLVNRYIAPLPLINLFALTTCVVARKNIRSKKEYSVSIIIPAKDEEGNIEKIVSSFPNIGKNLEFIFVEGNSTDKTWEKIQDQVNKYKNVKSFKQKGKGKADATRLGIEKSKGEILIIYDADRTVDAKDIVKFYEVLSSGKAEFANGSRLVYPMEKDAMRTLNKIGNKFFSILFTWLLGQRFKDTLCGTKAFFKKDYIKFSKFDDDPFGDFELIFGAIENNLKVIEIPIRYKERVYGKTNISRFRHGLLLFKMTISAFFKFKVFY